MYIVYLLRVYYPEYIKKSYNSTVKTNDPIKNGQRVVQDAADSELTFSHEHTYIGRIIPARQIRAE